jgi:surface protein
MSLILNYNIPSVNTTIGIYLAGSGSARATIAWGDGSSNTYDPLPSTPTLYTHTYSAAVTYPVNYSVDISGTNITQLGNGTTPATGIGFLRSVSSFGNVGLTSLNGAFNGATTLSNNGCMPTVIPPGLTNLSFCFANSNINDASINNWDTRNVTNFSFMFQNARVFNKNLNSWIVSNVTDFFAMFNGASAFNNGDVSMNWTLTDSSAIDMGYMFGDSSFNQDISWNTIRVTSMSRMFYNTPAYNGNANSWNVDNVGSFASMFQNSPSFNKNLNNWDVSKATSFSNMFDGAYAFNNGDVSLNWRLTDSSAINMEYMFKFATSFNQDISWNTDNVTQMNNMFESATSFNRNVNNWKVSNVITWGGMFQSATAFNNGNFPLIWTINNSVGINMGFMFQSARNFNQDISWNTDLIYNMSNMFEYATSFNKNCSNWNVSAVTNFTNMFNGAYSFNNGANAVTTDNAPLTWNLNTTNNLSLQGMFNGARSFSQDISTWNIKKVTNMQFMFNQNMTSPLFNRMLNVWSTLPSISPNVTFNNIKYTSALDVSNSLYTLKTSPNNWTINNGLVTYTPTSVNWGASFTLVYTVPSAPSVSGHSYTLVNSKKPAVTISTFESTTGQANYTFQNVVLQDYHYSTLYIIDTTINAIVDVVNINTIYPCFMEGTKILTDHGYVPIENLRKGDMVKTPLNEYRPVFMIGTKEIYNHALPERVTNQLYVCTPENYPEVFEDLVITGCHSILVDGFTSEEQKEKTREINGDIYTTHYNCITYMSAKYRLPACVDERTKIFEKEGPFTIYHIALEHDNYYKNYGIYANGLLVETCSKRYLTQLSNMDQIDEIQ